MNKTLWLLLILPVFCFGQTKKSDASLQLLINAIEKDFIPDSFHFYYLLDTGYITNMQSIFSNKIVASYSEKVDVDFGKYTVNDFEKEDSFIVWHRFLFPNARIISLDSMSDLFSHERTFQFISYKDYDKQKDSLEKHKQPNSYYVPVNLKWSKKKKFQAADSISDIYERNKMPETNAYYQFSSPAFSKDEKYAFIWVRRNEKETLYVYKRSKDIWVLSSALFETY